MSKICVHIIESPSSINLLDKQVEGLALQEVLKVSKIDSQYYLVTDESTFAEAINRIISYHKNQTSFQLPMIHISAHGNSMGIGLTSKGSLIDWKRLGKYLLQVNNTVAKEYLILCLSSCKGFTGFSMASGPQKTPYYLLVGSNDDINWTETIIGFSTFYHHMINLNGDNEKAVGAMNVAAGLHGKKVFTSIEGKQVRQQFYQALARLALKYSPK